MRGNSIKSVNFLLQFRDDAVGTTAIFRPATMVGFSWQSAVIGNMVFVERAKKKKMRFIAMS
jgi:hypothetical protein